MANDSADKKFVQKQLEELKKFAQQFSTKDIKDGTWFVTFLRYILKKYSEKVNAAYFKAKYPNLPADAVVDRRIELAQKYSAIEGGLSAGAYSAAVAATIGSGGGASPATIPAGAMAFTVDLLYTTKLQLELAYDLSVLYKHPIDMDDPEDLYDLFKVAFGVKAGELFRGGVAKLAPEAARVGVKHFVKGASLQFLKALPVVGKYLLQRNIVKFAIPVVAIPISAFMNHYSTGKIGQMARRVYRDKASIREISKQLAEEASASLLLLKTVFLVCKSDGTVAAEEAWLLKALTEDYCNTSEGKAVVEEFQKIVNVDETAILEELSTAPDHIRKLTFDAAMQAAAVDHVVNRKEVALLERLAGACGTSFDKRKLKPMAARNG